jgi:outer membrane protein assembly factor BamB
MWHPDLVFWTHSNDSKQNSSTTLFTSCCSSLLCLAIMSLKLVYRIALIFCLALFGLFAVSTPKATSQTKNDFRSQEAVGAQAVAYQIDPAHTGSQSDTVAPPLVQRWSRDLGGPISYPLIAEGKVFVTVANQTPTGVAGSKLYALDAATGATSWGPIDLAETYGWSGIAYDAGRIFALNYNGLLRAFDAASGAMFWETQLTLGPGQVWAFSSPPTALGGLVYTGGARNGGAVYAVSEQDGSIRWAAIVENGDASSPAVSADGVYVSYTCNQAYDFSPSTGNLIWHHAAPCGGGGGTTTVLFGGRLYARDVVLGNVVLNANTGEEITSFGADLAPAFSGSIGYYYRNVSNLQARDAVSGAVKWAFQGDGTLNSAPIVVNGYVYVGSHSGKLYALDASTGANVWTGNLGSAVSYTGEGFDVSAPFPGLSAGEGMIVVPAGTLLVAYQSALPIPTPTPTPTPGQNQIDQAQYFVHQHYLDFLNREPDQSGLDFWTNEITSCGSDQACIQLKRINVSAAFYLSIEFQQTGYFVERIYQAAYGDATGNSTLGGAHQLHLPIVRLNEFLPDMQQIGEGVIVGQGDWQQQLEYNKNVFAEQFGLRSRFDAAYPTTLTPTQFVNRLFANTGVTPTQADLATAIGEFGTDQDTRDAVAVGRALRDVAENPTLIQQETSRAFVLMQYMGYLRRNPNDQPDSDYSGYEFWLTKLNQFNGNFVNAEMVKAFISSGEYRQRFGP